SDACLGLSAIVPPDQQLASQTLGGLRGTLGMRLQVDVSLYRVDAAHAVLGFGSVEHSGIVRDHEPEVRTARLLAEAELLPQLLRGRLGEEERGDAEGGEVRQLP